MLWTIFFSIVVSLVTTVWLGFRFFNRHALQMCRSIPSVQRCYPLIGNVLMFSFSLNKTTERVLRILQDSVFNGNRAVCFWVGAYPIVIITDPDDMKKVLSNSLSRGKELEQSGNFFMKYGLITSPVDHWKITRRHLNLTFHHRNLEQMMPTFNSTSRQLVSDMFVHVEGPVFNLMPHVMSAALRTICTFLFGTKAMENVSLEEFTSLRNAVELVAQLVALRMTRPWLRIDIVFKLLYRKEINSVITAALNVTDKIKKNTQPTEEEKCDLDSRNGIFQTVLDTMRELQQKVSSVSDQHVLDELFSFFGAGTDTLGVTVSSCLLALARFPHIQDRVYEEICSVVSEDGDMDITHLDLKRLTYLEQVVKETLRYFTVVPFSPRAPNRDIDLGGYKIPANKTTFLWITSVCFDPKYFPDPQKFDPDRFSTPNSSDGVFIPFIKGPRNCIGKEYSMMLTKVMVTHVVRKYRLATSMDIQNLSKTFMTVLTCDGGYNVSLIERNKL